MAKKPQPKKHTQLRVIEVEGKTFDAIELDKSKQYLIGFDREKVTMETALAVLQSLENAGNRNVTAIMCEGDPRQSVTFFEVPKDEQIGEAE